MIVYSIPLSFETGDWSTNRHSKTWTGFQCGFDHSQDVSLRAHGRRQSQLRNYSAWLDATETWNVLSHQGSQQLMNPPQFTRYLTLFTSAYRYSFTTSTSVIIRKQLPRPQPKMLSVIGIITIATKKYFKINLAVSISGLYFSVLYLVYFQFRRHYVAIDSIVRFYDYYLIFV